MVDRYNFKKNTDKDFGKSLEDTLLDIAKSIITPCDEDDENREIENKKEIFNNELKDYKNRQNEILANKLKEKRIILNNIGDNFLEQQQKIIDQAKKDLYKIGDNQSNNNCQYYPHGNKILNFR